MPRAGRRPSAASDSGWPAARRLRRPAEFAAVRAGHRKQTIHASTPFLTMTALWSVSDKAGAALRFGLTIGRRQAPRAVDRSLLKRVLREATRGAAAALESTCAQRKLRVDVVLRLKAPLIGTDGAKLPVTFWRRQVRSEADGLLVELARRLGALLVASPTTAQEQSDA